MPTTKLNTTKRKKFCFTKKNFGRIDSGFDCIVFECEVKQCPGDGKCSGHGDCDTFTGRCFCFAGSGYYGNICESKFVATCDFLYNAMQFLLYCNVGCRLWQLFLWPPNEILFKSNFFLSNKIV